MPETPIPSGFARPWAEALEPRKLFSAVLRHDTLVVRPDDPKVGTTIVVGLAPGGHDFQVVTDGGPPATFPLEAADGQPAFFDVKVKGGSGNDLLSIDVTNGPPPSHVLISLYGGKGDDVLTGALHRSNVLDGGPGNDRLYAGSGDRPTAAVEVVGPTLVGGKGNDLLVGWDAEDTLVGGDGDDVLDGGPGKDFLEPRRGNDRVTGGSEADTFFVGPHPERRPSLITDKADEDTIEKRSRPSRFTLPPPFGIHFDLGWF